MPTKTNKGAEDVPKQTAENIQRISAQQQKEFNDEILRQVGERQIRRYHKIAGRLLSLLNDLQELMDMTDFDIDLIISVFNEMLKRQRNPVPLNKRNNDN